MQGVWITLQVFFKEVCPRDRERLLSEHFSVALNTSSFAEGSRIYVKSVMQVPLRWNYLLL